MLEPLLRASPSQAKKQIIMMINDMGLNCFRCGEEADCRPRMQSYMLVGRCFCTSNVKNVKYSIGVLRV